MELITSNSITGAWTQLMSRLLEPSQNFDAWAVSISEEPNVEDESMTPQRRSLDAALEKMGKCSTHTVANTLFPLSLWNKEKPRDALYDRYLLNAWPSMKRANPRGTYFYRLIQYGNPKSPINQLEHVIKTWNEFDNHRHSALQLGIFNPDLDHTNSRQLGFPCLHQISVTPHGANGSAGMSITGYYATQHAVTKAYGNYLGLIRIGRFIAHYLGLKLIKMNCLAARMELGVEKGQAKKICSEMDAI